MSAFDPLRTLAVQHIVQPVSPFENAQTLVEYLTGAGINCSVSEDGFVELPVVEADAVATLRPDGGWVVFKMFVGDWSPAPTEAACRTMLLFQDRLIGFRFSVTEGEIWVVQDFPIAAIGSGFEVYVHHALEMVGSVVPALLPYLTSDRVISEDEIDAIFGLLEARALN